jgi:hypothetical protein
MAFPHTHLQGNNKQIIVVEEWTFSSLGRTVWTKIIHNKTAEQYLFNGDAYQFNYQFQNHFPQPITLYPVCIV